MMLSYFYIYYSTFTNVTNATEDKNQKCFEIGIFKNKIIG